MPNRKILIVTNRIPYPLKDGGNLAMNAMIQGYHEAGWKVYLLSMNTTRHYVYPTTLKTLFTNIYRFEWLKVDNNLNALGIAKNFLFSRDPEHAGRFYKKDFEEKIVEIIRSFQPSVIQIESVFLYTYLPEIRANTNAITILRLHNIEYQIWQGLADKSSPFKKLYLNKLATRIRNFERDAWCDFDLLLPISERDANLVGRLEEVKDMVVAPFSIDAAKVPQGVHERWVGYHIGAMDWLPNQEGIRWFLEKAWRKIHRTVPAFEFYFAGRNMPSSFKNMHYNNVYCMDEVESAEAFISDKKILIVPIWSGGGIRVKILEAMAAGKVVISTRAGIKGIEAKPGEHYLLASEPDEFAKAVKWCVDNTEAAQKMAANARKLVHEKYDIQVVMRSILNEIEILFSERSGG